MSAVDPAIALGSSVQGHCGSVLEDERLKGSRRVMVLSKLWRPDHETLESLRIGWPPAPIKGPYVNRGCWVFSPSL